MVVEKGEDLTATFTTTKKKEKKGLRVKEATKDWSLLAFPAGKKIPSLLKTRREAQELLA